MAEGPVLTCWRPGLLVLAAASLILFSCYLQLGRQVSSGPGPAAVDWWCEAGPGPGLAWPHYRAVERVMRERRARVLEECARSVPLLNTTDRYQYRQR